MQLTRALEVTNVYAMTNNTKTDRRTVHANCTHPTTPKARRACRAARAGGVELWTVGKGHVTHTGNGHGLACGADWNGNGRGTRKQSPRFKQGTGVPTCSKCVKLMTADR